MKDIINWIIGVEQSAGALYREAAAYFSDDSELSSFLAEMAEEEDLHIRTMEAAAKYVKEKTGDTDSQIIFDAPFKDGIEAIFRNNMEKLSVGNFGSDSIMECIVTTEFSEWNDMFLYVVDRLKKDGREFQNVAAKMQNHLKQITGFVASRPEGIPYLEKVKAIPAVWRDKFLIVEDEPSLAALHKIAFSRQGEVEIAANGREALGKVKEKHFDVIVCDVGMPIMNGIEFYTRAAVSDPAIGKRFIFCTGRADPETIGFFEKEKVRYLLKPVSLKELKMLVADLLAESAGQLSGSEKSLD